MQTRAKFGIFRPKSILYLSTERVDPNPVSFSQAVKHSTWRLAMAEEFNAFLENDTWELVLRTPSMNVVDCKWIFKTKYAADGLVDRYKARLVALGNHQQVGIDYHETLSPLAKSSAVRLVLSINITCNWTVCQFNGKNVFLHGVLNGRSICDNLLVSLIHIFHIV